MDNKFNRLTNHSPRSGSSKKVTPVMWCVIVMVIVAVGIWLSTRT